MNSSFFTQGIAFGLLSALSWGSADLGFAYVSRQLGSLAAVFFSQFISAAILLLYIFTTRTSLDFATPALLLSIGAGVIHTLANLAFSRGLKLGKVSLVSPVAAGYSLVLVLAGVFIFSEHLSLIQVIAIFIVIAGTILASTNLKELLHSQKLALSDPGIPYALLAFASWPIGYLLLKQAVDQIGWVLPNLILFITQAIAIAAYLVLTRKKIKRPHTKLQTGAAILNGIGNTGGYVGYSLGVQRGFTAIVGPISAAFPALTIVLAHIFFKEKLVLSQYAGILSILCGVILLSL